MTKMNWQRVEKETRDWHAIRQGHVHPENPNRRGEADEGRTQPLQFTHTDVSSDEPVREKREVRTNQVSLLPSRKTQKAESPSVTVANLEQRVTVLKRQLAELKRQVAELQTAQRTYLIAKMGGLTQKPWGSPTTKKLRLKRRRRGY
jgi:hypothetical protein